MYGWIWNRLPGPTVLRLVLALALVAAAVTVLWFVVFPWAGPLLPFDQVDVS